MGLFSGLKNYLTGGGAEVTLEPFTIQLGGEARTASVNIKVKDSDIKSKELYLQLRCTYFCHEHELEWKDTDNDQIPDNVEIKSEKITGSVRFEKIVMDNTPVYPKNAELSFEKPIVLGNEFLPFITDRVVWSAMAGIDTSGNDPDSDWMEIYVSNPIVVPQKKQTTLTIRHSIGEKEFTFKFSLDFVFGIINLDDFYRSFGDETDLTSPEVLQHITNIFELKLAEILSKKLPDQNFPKSTISGFEIFNEIKPAENEGLALWYFDIAAIEVH